jgi:hypothetical protein
MMHTERAQRKRVSVDIISHCTVGTEFIVGRTCEIPPWVACHILPP